MGLIVPNPTVPTDGQPVEATTLAANLNAVYSAIQSFDASQIQSASLPASAFVTSINPNTILHDTITPFVQSGCIWHMPGGLVGTMDPGVIYVGTGTATYRTAVLGVGSNTFTASRDTYIDIDYNGNITYQAVANNATSPAITANSVRVAIVVTDGSAISSINQGSTTVTAPVISSRILSVSDSLGNLIYPTANQSLLGHAYSSSNITTAASGSVQAIAALSTTIIIPSGPSRRLKLTLDARDMYYNGNATGFTHIEIWQGTVGSGTKVASTQNYMSASTQSMSVHLENEVTLAPGAYTFNVGAFDSATVTRILESDPYITLKAELNG